MAVPALPSSDDPEMLKALLAEERRKNKRLRKSILAMQRDRFGRRAENLLEDQFLLGLEKAEQVEAAGFDAEESELAKKAQRVKRLANRGALPAHLPRVDYVIDIDRAACPCCAPPLHRIGADATERLDVMLVQFQLRVIRRPRYACRSCRDAIVQTPTPARLIEGGLPTDALIARVLIPKHTDYLTLYRQGQILARLDISLDRSTLANWVGRAAFHLRPVKILVNDGAGGLAYCRRPVMICCHKLTKRNTNPQVSGLRTALMGPLRYGDVLRFRVAALVGKATVAEGINGSNFFGD